MAGAGARVVAALSPCPAHAPVTKILLTLCAAATLAIVSIPAIAADTAGMDRAVRPGDDFYRYANGRWQQAAVIPAGSGFIYGNVASRQTSIGRLGAIVDELAAQPDSRAGILFRSYMDATAVERLGLSPARATLRDILALDDRDALAVAMARYERLGVDTFIAGSVDDDPSHPGHRALHWQSAGLGMGDRSYYQAGTPGADDVSRAYEGYVRHLLALAGVHDAPRVAADVVAFERRLAAPEPPADDAPTDGAVSIEELERHMPGMPWQRLTDAFGWPRGRTMLVDEPNVLASRMETFLHTPVATARAYLVVRFLDAYAPYLPSDVANAAYDFHQGTLRGVGTPKPRHERGVDLVHRFVPDDIEAIYASRYFPPATKAAAEDLVRHVRDAFGRRLARVPWMDEATRERAIAKLRRVVVEVGYPDIWHTYPGLTFREGDLFGNVMRGEAWAYDWRLAQLDRPYDRREWTCVYPSTVNACSDNGRLALFFPAAYLQPPTFDPAADAAENYGRAGETIGHELTHPFDPGGSMFDENGRRSAWWPRAVRERFAHRTRAVVDQYDAYEAAPGMTIDGKRTLGENVADLGGLNIAYDAYRAAIGGRQPATVNGLTGDQRFFLAFASNQRAKFTDAGLRAQMLNVHAPGPQRLLEVRNVDAWYRAFDVRAGDRLYLPPERRVVIW